MAVYDMAHRLVRAIKNSDEYNDYQEIRKKIIDDQKARDMLVDYQKEEFKLQAKQFSGQEISEEDKERISKLREIINLNQKVKKYIEAEYRMGTILNDLQQIIFSDLEIGIEKEDEEEEEEDNVDNH